jgi:hypothetical protein
MTARWQSYPGFLTTPCRFASNARLATPSPGPPRLKKTPAAGHPLPQGGEGRPFIMRGRCTWPEKSQPKCGNSRAGLPSSSLFVVRNPGYNCFRENASISASRAFTCSAEGASA